MVVMCIKYATSLLVASAINNNALFINTVRINEKYNEEVMRVMTDFDANVMGKKIGENIRKRMSMVNSMVSNFFTSLACSNCLIPNNTSDS